MKKLSVTDTIILEEKKHACAVGHWEVFLGKKWRKEHDVKLNINPKLIYLLFIRRVLFILIKRLNKSWDRNYVKLSNYENIMPVPSWTFGKSGRPDLGRG